MLNKMNNNITTLMERMAALEARPSTSTEMPRAPQGQPSASGHHSRVPPPEHTQDNREDPPRTPIYARNTPPEENPPPRERRGRFNHFRDVQDDFEPYEHFEGFQEEEDQWERQSRRHEQGPRPRRPREPEQDGVGKVKVTIPPFEGKCDPDTYLEWETKIEHIWSCHNFTDYKKVQLATLEFSGFALIWWDTLVKERRRALDAPVATWEQMKALMRARFIPQHYARELKQRLENLKQGSMSVEEAFNAMQLAMARANVVEDEEDTNARFLRILHPYLAREVDCYPYTSVIDLLHLAVKVDRKLKARDQGGARGGNRSSSTQPYGRDALAPREKPSLGNGGEQGNRGGVQAISSAKPPSPLGNPKGGTPNPSNLRNREVVCFKCQDRGHMMKDCPHRKALMVDHLGNTNSEIEHENDECLHFDCDPILNSYDDCDDEGIEYEHGESLIVRRALHVNPTPCDDNQRENLFHTRCLVKGKVCNVIIDGGSCCNLASTELVEKLQLSTIHHPRPYKLHWMNDCGALKVNKQVKVSFKLGHYEDDVLCDIVPMQASHLLFGRPWQFDRKVLHDGFTNRYSFEYKGRNFTLKPMTPTQIAGEFEKKESGGSVPSKVFLAAKREFVDKNLDSWSNPFQEGEVDAGPSKLRPYTLVSYALAQEPTRPQGINAAQANKLRPYTLVSYALAQEPTRPQGINAAQATDPCLD